MKKILLSVAIIAQMTSVYAEVDYQQSLEDFITEWEQRSAGLLSKENEKLIASWMIELSDRDVEVKPILQFRKLPSEVPAEAIPVPYCKGHKWFYAYWFINEDFFDSLIINEKKAFVLTLAWPAITGKDGLTENLSWVASFLNNDYEGYLGLCKKQLARAHTMIAQWPVESEKDYWKRAIEQLPPVIEYLEELNNQKAN